MHKKHVHEMLEKLASATHSEITTKPIEHINTEEMGEVIDMIKDLCEAEEKIYKACYYKSIVEAMEEEEKYEEELEKAVLKRMIEEHGEVEGRMGYDRWRNAHGRFARKGHGHETSMAMATGRHGFTPDPYHNPPYYDDPRMWGEPWMASAGYDGNGPRLHDGRTDGGHHEQHHATGRMGYTPMHDGKIHSTTGKGTHYDMYDQARRHFQETGDQQHKQHMSEKARDYVDETISTMREMFVESDPEMQKKMRDDLSRLYREFGGK